jgi:hypothetical protein
VGDYLTELCPGWVGGGDMPGTRPTHLDGRYLAVQGREKLRNDRNPWQALRAHHGTSEVEFAS